ncbi:A/G-specific adenine glycosylase [Flavobacterium sp.]|uniref:A/G-specific adenine glycosylase n=1 Tax=Flavobacterium sp. TaxID=239 RepID=UPI003526E3B0
MTFSNRLISWYLENKRNLPWRKTINPYHIWLSEVILQQTRVAQGLPYYIKFTEVFPTVFDLANASEEQVLKLWQGLGYYSRGRNLHKTAQIVAFEHKGIFPKTYNELLKLKGIGTYTAAAIASFSQKEVVPVVDGNVYRVLARYFDLETDISSTSAKKEFTSLANELIDKKQPDVFNQALMEFGALQCIPKKPNCSICVFNDSCAALQKKKVDLLPIKLKKTKVTERFFNYLVLEDENEQYVIQQRTTKDIWYNLYEFPLIESKKELNEKEVKEKLSTTSFFTNKLLSLKPYDEKSVLHILSHQRLKIRFWEIKVEGILREGISKEAVKKLPFPIVIFNFIEKNF